MGRIIFIWQKQQNTRHCDGYRANKQHSYLQRFHPFIMKSCSPGAGSCSAGEPNPLHQAQPLCSLYMSSHYKAAVVLQTFNTKEM